MTNKTKSPCFYLYCYCSTYPNEIIKKQRRESARRHYQETVPRHKEYRERHSEQIRQQNKMVKEKRRLLLFEILGGAKCVRCGFSDIRALQFDHIYGNGCKDRRDRNLSGSDLIKYYSRNPEEAKQKLQVLCCNCNWIKRWEKGEFQSKTDG